MKITKVEKDAPHSVKRIKAKTTDRSKPQMSQWWKETNDIKLNDALLGTAAFLKQNQLYRQRQASLYARLYGNVSLFAFIGNTATKMDLSTGLPTDRPTFNLIQSSVDTLVARISQDRPEPVFLTDNSDYKERNLAKKLNGFILGEFYQTKAYEKSAIILRDAMVLGTGCLKIYEDVNHKVQLDRVLQTELFVDINESIYGDPRQLYQIRLIDRSVLSDMFPEEYAKIQQAEQSTVDSSADSSQSVADMVMLVEAWRLPSGPNSNDGRHTIGCSAGLLFDEPYTKDQFPFIWLNYSPRMLGFWAQGIPERLMGTQLEINSLLWTMSKSIKLAGIPRVYLEDGSKVSNTSMNNDVGVIVNYRGTKPIIEVAQCVAPEMYTHLESLIQRGYQQEGVSVMAAGSQKPAGLNSGEAIRSYDDISTDRFATLARRYSDFFVALAYQIMDLAMDICKVQGKYQTVYPNKNGAKEIDLPKMSILKDDFIIQAFTMSSLPREPAGRFQKVAEMIQSGMISIKEGRRLLDYPDLQQMETLANASEERIFKILDEIVEEGKYSSPDPFMDLQLANDIVVQYINLYSASKLEESKAQMLRDFFTQIQAIKQAMIPSNAGMPPGQNPPQATPQPLPQSELLPNANTGGQ